MAEVKLYSQLRRFGGSSNLTIPGRTVGEVLAALCAEYEALCNAILLDGQVRPHVRNMIAGRDIELEQGLLSAVQDDEPIAIFPPIAGGYHSP